MGIHGSTPNRLNPHDALAVFNALVKNRQRLIVMLSASYDPEPDELQGQQRSIFDR